MCSTGKISWYVRTSTPNAHASQPFPASIANDIVTSISRYNHRTKTLYLSCIHLCSMCYGHDHLLLLLNKTMCVNWLHHYALPLANNVKHSTSSLIDWYVHVWLTIRHVQIHEPTNGVVYILLCISVHSESNIYHTWLISVCLCYLFRASSSLELGGQDIFFLCAHVRVTQFATLHWCSVAT